ncbi:MAG: extracellular solute-binding protein [Oscillospiraceae bacterium]|nr:extracellular solute-binding protein [Oscillospiraceae bacterium]
MKKYIMAPLVLALLSGLFCCTGDKAANHAKYGVYDMGVEITDFRDIYVFDDERHLVFTEDLQIYTINITTGEKNGLEYELPENMTPIKACGDDGGNLHILAQNNGHGENRIIYKFSSDGKLHNQMNYTKLDGASWLLDMYAFGDDIVLVFDSGIKVLNSEKGAIENNIEYIHDSCVQNTSATMYMYLLLRNDAAPSGCNILKFDVAKNKVIWNTKVQDFIGSTCFDYESGQVVYTDGMSVYTLDGSSGKTLDESVCELFNHIAVGRGAELFSGKNGIYVLRHQDGENKIFSLAVGEANKKTDFSDTKKTIITFRVRYPTMQLTNAVKEYEEINNVQIVFDFYSNSISFDDEAYTKNTNIMLMSGTAEWDLMLTNGLDYNLYAKKNYFADLYGLGARELLESGKYYGNIIKASETEGRLYVFPLNLSSMPLYVNAKMWDEMTNGAEFFSWEEILDYFDGDTGGKYIFAASGLSVNFALRQAQFNFSANIDKFMKEEWKRPDAIAEIQRNLDIYKRLHDEKYTAEENSGQGLVLECMISRIAPDVLNWDLPNIKIVNMPSLIRGQEPAFSLMGGAAVMSKSKNKEEAYKLLKYISEHDTGFGAPINRELFQMENESWQEMIFSSAKAEQKAEINRLYIELDTARENLVSQFADFGIGKIVFDESRKMMENNRDTKKTAESVYDRVWTYYNE